MKCSRTGLSSSLGSLHSCSRIVVSDAILDTSGLPKEMDFEDGDTAVVATANVSLHDFPTS